MMRILIAKETILFMWVVGPFSFLKARLGNSLCQGLAKRIWMGSLRSNWFF